jgi:shikimate kinase
VVLVGFMGAGKSATGRVLAQRLGWGFVDLDHLVEQAAGRDVAAIFADGEPAFRALEEVAARQVGQLQRHVVAAGGGAFAQPLTRALLQADALCVWLRCELDVALGRIAGHTGRPLAGNRERMRQLLAQREESYRQADLTVDATLGTVSEVASRVWDALREPLGVTKAADNRCSI